MSFEDYSVCKKCELDYTDCGDLPCAELHWKDGYKEGRGAALRSLLDYLKERKEINSKFVRIYGDEPMCEADPSVGVPSDCNCWKDGKGCILDEDGDKCYISDEIASERKILGEIGVIETYIEKALARGNSR